MGMETQKPGVAIGALGLSSCRFVLDERGADGLALYCGADTGRPGASWCPYHWQRVFHRQVAE